MNPKLYWIDGPWSGRLAISARPRGGDWLADEVSGWRRAGVDAVVSLLTLQENRELQLAAESDLAHAHGLHFLSLPIEDRGVPANWEAASHVVAKAGEMLKQGRNVAVHCRQGIGRSGMIAAALLIRDGSTADAALRLIGEARGLAVPETTEQREWLRKFAAQQTPLTVPLTRASVK